MDGVSMSGWLLTVLGESSVAAILVAAAGWLFREWIGGRLTARLRVETEQKLQEFKARLDTAEAQVSSVRQAGIDAMLQVSGVVVAERVAATKRIWNGVIEWKTATAASMIVSAIDADWVHNNAGLPKTREWMGKLLHSIRYMDLMKAMNALQECRPFVTERAWALFAAYHVFYVARLMRAFSLTLSDKELANRLWEVDNEMRVVRATAPPLIVQVYEKASAVGTAPFLTYVEQELLSELQKSLAGEHGGPEASRQAAKIVAAADVALQEAQKVDIAPGP